MQSEAKVNRDVIVEELEQIQRSIDYHGMKISHPGLYSEHEYGVFEGLYRCQDIIAKRIRELNSEMVKEET